ncbi:hypothetical protein CEUSTIGMA_g5491.t1 [Chlamydomonas eustigma]|uniref:RAP domain-containing protein n=1 Tax=Chlamydomonas eustigma TaxID=1157962 RepID=A0A250X556_9CHLO|nr:hypothetical protein CEUSTIGMA_g5491.t1 [Chlamydomonas eustigma]|eukprot:GAX78049.1 hypothetical protein CEUSTIGMA_g5491.t1 [Chlamydomonas eustigma]
MLSFYLAGRRSNLEQILRQKCGLFSTFTRRHTLEEGIEIPIDSQSTSSDHISGLHPRESYTNSETDDPSPKDRRAEQQQLRPHRTLKYKDSHDFERRPGTSQTQGLYRSATEQNNRPPISDGYSVSNMGQKWKDVSGTQFRPHLPPFKTKEDSRDWTLRLRYLKNRKDKDTEQQSDSWLGGPGRSSAATSSDQILLRGSHLSHVGGNEYIPRDEGTEGGEKTRDYPHNICFWPLAGEDSPSYIPKNPAYMIAQSIPKCTTLKELSDLVTPIFYTHFNEVHLGKAMGRLAALIQTAGMTQSSVPVGRALASEEMGAEAGKEATALPEGADSLIKMLLQGAVHALHRRNRIREQMTSNGSQGASNGSQGAPSLGDDMVLFSSLMTFLLKLDMLTHPVMKMLVANLPEQGYQRLHDGGDRAFASVIWCLAKLHTAKVMKLPLQDLESVIITSTMKRIQEGCRDSFWIATISNSAAKLGVRDKAMYSSLAHAAKQVIQRQMVESYADAVPSLQDGNGQKFMNPTCVASLMTGCALVRYYDKHLMSLAGQLFLLWSQQKQGVYNVNPQAWSNYLWSCGVLLHQDSDFLQKAVPFITALQFKNADRQVVSNVIWTYAVLKHYDESLLNAATAFYLRNKDQHVSFMASSICAWSFLTLGHFQGGGQLIEETADQTFQTQEQEPPNLQHRLVYMWSLVGLVPHRIDLLSKFMRSNMSVLTTLRELGIIHFVVNELREREKTPRMIEEKKDVPDECPTDISSSNMENPAVTTPQPLTGSSDALPLPDDSRFWSHVHVKMPLTEKAGSGEGRETSDCLKDDHAGETSADSNLQEKQIRDRQYLTEYWKNLSQVYSFCRVLYQAHLELSDQGFGHQGLQGEELEACRYMWRFQYNRPWSSQVHDEIFDILKAMGLTAHKEQFTEDGAFSIDIVLQHPVWGRVGVEVDGPYHFLSNLPRVPHGKTLVRNRFLERRMDRLISINIDQDFNDKHTLMRRRKFLRELFEL